MKWLTKEKPRTFGGCMLITDSLCGCADGHLRPGDPHRTEHAAGKLLSRAFARSRTGNYHQPESSQEGRFNL